MTAPPLTPRERALAWLWPTEGGYGNPDQPTNMGVIQPTLDTAIRRKLVPPSTSLRSLTRLQAGVIYTELFWVEAGCGVLAVHAPALAVALFDGAVNSGPGQSVQWLQAALNEQGEALVLDGVLGFRTLAAVQARPQGAVLGALLNIRREFDRGVARRQPRKAKFLPGWLDRINRLEALCRSLLPAPEGKA